MYISLHNVPFGWQIVINDTTSGSTYNLGPVHRSVEEAWAWQEANLVKQEDRDE